MLITCYNLAKDRMSQFQWFLFGASLADVSVSSGSTVYHQSRDFSTCILEKAFQFSYLWHFHNLVSPTHHPKMIFETPVFSCHSLAVLCTMPLRILKVPNKSSLLLFKYTCPQHTPSVQISFGNLYVWVQTKIPNTVLPPLPVFIYWSSFKAQVTLFIIQSL